MESSDHSQSLLNTFDTPIGPVTCGLFGNEPLLIESIGRARTSSRRLMIEHSYFDLPKDWNAGYRKPDLDIDGGRCWRWWFTCLSGASTSMELRCAPERTESMNWDTATGEDLAAIEYQSQGTTLHIGTEDEPRKLSARAQMQNGLFPKRLLCFLDELIALDHSGLMVRIPPLHEGESVYFHIITAYKHNEGGIATWLAVDRSMQEVDDWESR